MKSLYAFTALLTVLLCSACGGRGSALPSSAADEILAHSDACAVVSTSADFNATPIAKASWILFSSVLSVRGAKSPLVLEMRQSRITFDAGRTHYSIEGPNMRLELTDGSRVRLHYPPFGDHWEMFAPYATKGRDFLNNIRYQTNDRLPGNITNVTWSAMFYGNGGRAVRWQWGAAVYSKLTSAYGKLDVKALDDAHYPPFNGDRAGTPEAFKEYVAGGGTGDGGSNYTGSLSSPVSVTPCRS